MRQKDGQQSQMGTQLVDRPVGFQSLTRFLHANTTDDTRLSLIARTGIDFSYLHKLIGIYQLEVYYIVPLMSLRIKQHNTTIIQIIGNACARV